MKKLLIVPLIVVLAVALTGCGSSGTNSGSGTAANSGADSSSSSSSASDQNIAVLMAGNRIFFGDALADQAGNVIYGDVMENGDIAVGQVDAKNQILIGEVKDGKAYTLVGDMFGDATFDANGNLINTTTNTVFAKPDGTNLVGGSYENGVVTMLETLPIKASVDNKGYVVVGYLLADGSITNLDNQSVGTVDAAGNVKDSAGNTLGNMLTN